MPNVSIPLFFYFHVKQNFWKASILEPVEPVEPVNTFYPFASRLNMPKMSSIPELLTKAKESVTAEEMGRFSTRFDIRISESYSAEKKTNYFEFDDTSFLHTEYRIVCKEMAFLRLLQINSSALQLPRDEKESLYRDLNNRYGNEIVLKTHVIMEELKRFNDWRQEEMEIVKELPSDLCPNAVQNAQKVSDTFRCFFNQFWNHILSLLARLKNRLKLNFLLFPEITTFFQQYYNVVKS